MSLEFIMNKLFSLVLATTILTTNPLFAMDDDGRDTQNSSEFSKVPVSKSYVCRCSTLEERLKDKVEYLLNIRLAGIRKNETYLGTTTDNVHLYLLGIYKQASICKDEDALKALSTPSVEIKFDSVRIASGPGTTNKVTLPLIRYMINGDWFKGYQVDIMMEPFDQEGRNLTDTHNVKVWSEKSREYSSSDWNNDPLGDYKFVFIPK